MRVSNRKCVRNLSIKNMRSAGARNRIAVLAIALTTILFTSLFTIFMSAIDAFQQSNFRMVGGYEHGGLKSLSAEQLDEFKTDERIAAYGKRMYVGSPTKEPLHKSQVEVGCVDENYAKFTFANFKEGGLPRENTNEAAADSRVLELLGVEPKLGNEFTMTFDVAGKETTQSFVLCGYWEYDEILPANSVYIPFSRGDQIIEELGVVRGEDGYAGRYSLDFMLKSGSRHIEKDICEMIVSHGYCYDDPSAENFIDYGVNWGYAGAQLTRMVDPVTGLALAAILIVIFVTGYLMIYNVFRISVANDIRYYGLLKTIGTTGRQIRRILSTQALILSAVGIPTGLLMGYAAGALLTPLVLGQMDSSIRQDTLSVNPLIFLFSAAFSLCTVLLSCRKPGKIAAKISPVEAVRYTESEVEKTVRRSKKGAGIVKMAAANLLRSKSKTATTILSLSLSVLLLHFTVTFAGGFDMDKYLRNMPVDFIVSDASYFNTGTHARLQDDRAFVEQEHSDIRENIPLSGMGVVYGQSSEISSYAPKEHILEKESLYWGEEEAKEYVQNRITLDDGRCLYDALLYGMESFCLDRLTVLDGDLSKLTAGGAYIATVYSDDDYGNPESDSHWAKVGDKVTIEYNDSGEQVWVDLDTGKEYENAEDVPADSRGCWRAKESRKKEYEVAALVMIPHALSYRFYGADQYVLGAEAFKQDTGTDSVLYTAFDVKEGAEDAAEAFMADYTEKIHSQLSYESKNTYAGEFDSFRSMFLILGSLLSFIVGLIGMLNFTNVALTGIFSRRRELAVLQAVGMTGRQLKGMLMSEGLFYTLGAAGLSLVICLALSPLSKRAMEKVFWFFSYRFTLLPVLLLIPLFAILGALIPLLSYQSIAKKTIVERLRETEG